MDLLVFEGRYLPICAQMPISKVRVKLLSLEILPLRKIFCGGQTTAKKIMIPVPLDRKRRKHEAGLKNRLSS